MTEQEKEEIANIKAELATLRASIESLHEELCRVDNTQSIGGAEIVRRNRSTLLDHGRRIEHLEQHIIRQSR